MIWVRVNGELGFVMKILVVTKRQSTGKDFLDEHFGRMWEFPCGLARCGNTVRGVCLSYKEKEEGVMETASFEIGGSINWFSVNLQIKCFPFGLIRFLFRAIREVITYKPDVILGMSDIFYVVFGYLLACLAGKKCVADLQDNYESYSSAKIPGMLTLFKRVLSKAAGIVCVSEELADMVRSKCANNNTRTIVNAISPDLFFPAEKETCRRKLNLPLNNRIIGIGGALHKDRGVEVLFQGLRELLKSDNSLRLAVTGQRDLIIPEDLEIIDLGMIEYDKMPMFFNSLDVAVICSKDTLLDRYAFPQKAYEIIACQTPLIVSNAGPLLEILKDYPDIFFDPNDVKSFETAVKNQLKDQIVPDVPVSEWSVLSEDLDTFIRRVVVPQKET